VGVEEVVAVVEVVAVKEVAKFVEITKILTSSPLTICFPQPPGSENSKHSSFTPTAEDTSMDIEAPPLAFW
jgi:hypothetical protein